ncbi:hypothetical protein [Exiguobacterium algae]|uniref:hypothetical protein n=1 Tax=Exiguobacterium algae TaxID=2751250 RepID=UPI001BE68E9C|nr:hypothetical protein [Exiguobacterium algae]
MELIEMYVNEVARHVPPKRRDEVALAVREEIEAMLSSDPAEPEIKRTLEQMGHPAVVAARYKKGQYLIGPSYFAVYVSVLKTVVPIVLAVLFFSLLLASIPTLNEPSFPTVGALVGDVFGALWNVGIQLLFWITLIFFLVERYAPANASDLNVKWDVSKLHDRSKEGRIRKFEAGFGLFWTVVWFGVYLNAERLLGIYESTGDGLEMVTPIFNQAFLFDMLWLFMIVILMQVVLGTWKWIRGYWTYALATFNAFYNFVSAIFVIWMVRSSELFDSRFISWIETNFAEVSTFKWIGTLIIVVTIFGGVMDTISGFRKAYKTPTVSKRNAAHT